MGSISYTKKSKGKEMQHKNGMFLLLVFNDGLIKNVKKQFFDLQFNFKFSDGERIY